MADRKRPFLAPTDTLHRVIYAALALIAPRVLIQLAYQDHVDTAWVILCFWWLATFLYTIDWAIASYRTWRFKKGTV